MRSTRCLAPARAGARHLPLRQWQVAVAEGCRGRARDVEGTVLRAAARGDEPPRRWCCRRATGASPREDESLRNDISAHFLVEALDGVGDRNLDGAVTATEAHDYARRKTLHVTSGRQHPSAKILEVGADPVVSGRGDAPGQPRAVLVQRAARRLHAEGRRRREGRAAQGGAAVAPGKRSVELTKGGVMLLVEVTVEAGDRVDLDSLLQRSEPHRAVSVTGGVFGFADAVSRAELLPAVPTAGASVRFERVFGSPITTHIELGLDGHADAAAQRSILVPAVDAVGRRRLLGVTACWSCSSDRRWPAWCSRGLLRCRRTTARRAS